MSITDLIEHGRKIENSLQYVSPGKGVGRTFLVYKLADVDDYYRWKELSIRALQLYYTTDKERFVKYSEDFEKHHYLPQYISNMIGLLEACNELPSEKIAQLKEVEDREHEIEHVRDLEKAYVNMTGKDSIHQSIAAFHAWHAAACVLFDKWFYQTDEDWITFQDIEGDGNGYVLKDQFDKVYSSYQKLMARLTDGRELKGVVIPHSIRYSVNEQRTPQRISIFISYAHADERWLKRLKKHLTVLDKFTEPIDYWEDTKLKGGDKWKETIKGAIDKANVAILLVSTDFLASDFITSEELPSILRHAEEGGTKVIPLIVAPCSFELSEISEFQAINSPDRTLLDLGSDEAAIDRVFLELVKTIRSLL